jgi:hypothetical protein
MRVYLPAIGGVEVYGRFMSNLEPDPGGNTEMFRAFVASSEHYEPRAGAKGPLVVALIALLIAIAAFVVIVSIG